MKRWPGLSLSLLLFFVLALSLAGCDGTATPTVAPPTGTAQSPVPTAPTPSSQTVAIHFIDVGQGDAILILTPEGKAALIDGGPVGSRAAQYLQDQGVRRLDVVVATHPHEDHIGGLVEVLRSVPVAQVVTNGQAQTTPIYERFVDAIAAAKAPYREVKRGDTLQVGSLVLDVLSPMSSTGKNINDQSIVLRMVHGQTSFLFTGDAEQAAEASMLISSFRPVKADVLKVGHHGSRSSSSPSFLALVEPQIAIYSAAKDNEFKHPHPQTLSALAKVGATVYGTDTHGTVVVTSDGAAYSVRTSKSASERGPPAHEYGAAIRTEALRDRLGFGNRVGLVVKPGDGQAKAKRMKDAFLERPK